MDKTFMSELFFINHFERKKNYKNVYIYFLPFKNKYLTFQKFRIRRIINTLMRKLPVFSQGNAEMHFSLYIIKFRTSNEMPSDLCCQIKVQIPRLPFKILFSKIF